MAVAFIGLGSNLGKREHLIWNAVDHMAAHGKIRVDLVSNLVETKPLGDIPQPDYINAVAKIETELEPLELLDTLLEIERRMGRQRREKWGPRVIDLDILVYDERVWDDERLTLPHPEIMNRPFVQEGLKELGYRWEK